MDFADGETYFGKEYKTLRYPTKLDLSGYSGRCMIRIMTPRTYEYLPNVQHLDLTHNRILSLPVAIFKSQNNLRTLNLSGKMIENVNFEIKHMPKLSHIDIFDNRISHLDVFFTKQLDDLTNHVRQLTVDMSGNPIKCTCDSIEFIQRLATTKIQLNNTLQQECDSMKMYLNNSKTVYDQLKKKCSSYVTTVVALALWMVVFVITMIGGLLYRYRWKIRYLYYIVKSKHQGETTIDDIEEPDATKYINLLKDKIVIDQFPLKIKIIITSEFATPIAFDRIESHYSHPAKVVLTQNNLSKFYDDLIDKFKAWVDQFQERGSGLPFVIYCDFEACNIPMQSCTPDPDKSYTKPISKQEINSYGMYVHSDYPEIYKSQYFHYDGDDVVKNMWKNNEYIQKITYNIKHNKKDKPILNKYEEDEFQEATECYICGKEFEENNKVREHDHLSGKYRGAACQSCNTKEGKATKLIPVFFHNGSNYDFHFLIEELMKHEDEYNKVKLLSKNSENYISIDYGSYNRKLRFLDSYRFMLKGLSDVAKSMDDFPILEKEFEGNKPLGNEEKIIFNRKRQKKYIVHYKVLKDYIKLGMKVTKVYKTISFKESDWLAKYINFNTEQRTKSKSDFEKDLWKLMNNSFYGKTLEDIRGRSEIKLLTDREEVKNI
ncbi:unnamed protein product [Mytilus coruscus]|uniref:C2H2-type domain-containing protein n=1 Tax=Mytilus coruscus TaxID=42192 RepID=A0A6J8CBP8_MYTCO|nr:unnamed protein product [Mytilus coruscus]